MKSLNISGLALKYFNLQIYKQLGANNIIWRTLSGCEFRDRTGGGGGGGLAANLHFTRNTPLSPPGLILFIARPTPPPPPRFKFLTRPSNQWLHSVYIVYISFYIKPINHIFSYSLQLFVDLVHFVTSKGRTVSERKQNGRLPVQPPRGHACARDKNDVEAGRHSSFHKKTPYWDLRYTKQDYRPETIYEIDQLTTVWHPTPIRLML